MSNSNHSPASSDHCDLDRIFAEKVREQPELAKLFELPPNSAPNLTNPIHPIFAARNFPSLTSQQYTGMLPALQLCSLFLTTQPMLDWFVHAAYAIETVHPTRADEKLLEQIVTEYGRGHYFSVADALASLADFIDFDFDIYPGFVSCGRTRLYETDGPRVGTAHSWFQQANRERRRVQARLHADFKLHAASAAAAVTSTTAATSQGQEQNQGASGANTSNPAELAAHLRYWFFLAVTLMHETCHAFGLLKRNGADEPFFAADAPVADWGTAWEMWALGGEINPWHEARLAPTATLLAADWADRRAQRANGGLAQSVVPVAWIARWFRRRFWARLLGGDDARSLPVCELRVWMDVAAARGALRDGLVSAYVTDVPSEEPGSSDGQANRQVSDGEDLDSAY